jgi:3-hydroxyisobutyrate dehydrogenase
VSDAGSLHVAFVGLGNMGAPMVRNLAAAGFPLTVRDANAELQAALADELGATAATASGDFASADVVVTMLPDDRAVSAVMLEWDGGVAASLRPGAVVVDMSSSNPKGTIELGKALAERGVGLVDAPVSGGIARAVTGMLALMAGTDDPA